jgi:hypothetical protein
MTNWMGRLLLVACSLALAPAASAATAFTINVPVSFQSLNAAVVQVVITCHVSGNDPVTGQNRTFGPVMGKSTNLPLANGNYAGPGAIAILFDTSDFTPQEQASLGNVTQAACSFALQSTDGNLYIPYGSETTPILAHKPGTVLRSITQAMIPK